MKSKGLTPDDALDLVGRRMAIRLSMLVKDKAFGEFLDERKKWRRELEAIDKELLAAGLLKPVGPEEEPEESEDVGVAEPGKVVTLKGKNFHTESEATEPDSATRPCQFCDDTGERIVDIEIGGLTYEMVVDCLHPYT